MATLASRISSIVTRIATQFNTVKSQIGDLTTLTTTNKTSVVASLNEVKSTTAAINDTTASLSAVYSSTKTNNLLSTKLDTTGSISATQISSGVFDPARIPTISFFKPFVSTAASIPSLSAPDQANISIDGKSGTFNVVTLSDGSSFVYGGGSKILLASYTLITDITPEWNVIANKPTTVSGFAISDAITTTAIGDPDTDFVTLFNTSLT